MKVRSIVKQSHEAVPKKQRSKYTTSPLQKKKNILLVHETPFPERPEKKKRKQKKRGVCEESFSEAMSDVHFNTGRSVCDTLLKNPAASLCNVRNMVSQFDEAVERFKVQLLMKVVDDFLHNSIGVCWKRCHRRSRTRHVQPDDFTFRRKRG